MVRTKRWPIAVKGIDLLLLESIVFSGGGRIGVVLRVLRILFSAFTFFFFVSTALYGGTGVTVRHGYRAILLASFEALYTTEQMLATIL